MSRLYEALRNAQSDLPTQAPAPARPALPSGDDSPILRLSQAIDARLPDRPRRAVQIVGCTEAEDADTLAKRLARFSAQTLGRSVLLLDTQPPRVPRKAARGHGPVADIPAVPAMEPRPLMRRAQAAPYGEGSLFEHTEGGGVDPNRLAGAWLRLRAEYELVLVQTTPAGTPIGLAVAPTVDGVVLVVEAEKTSLAAALAARDGLLAGGANLLGVVLDKERSWGAANDWRRR